MTAIPRHFRTVSCDRTYIWATADDGTAWFRPYAFTLTATEWTQIKPLPPRKPSVDEATRREDEHQNLGLRNLAQP